MSDPNQPAEGDPFAPPPAGGSANIPGIPGDPTSTPPPPPPLPAYGTTPPPPPAYGAPQPYGAPVAQPQNGPGTTALVLGILSLVCCGIFTGIVAIIMGRKGMALADQGLATNRGIAQAGFVLGIVGSVLSVLGAIFWIATGSLSTFSSSVGG